jgi:hypothetical protein
MSQLFAFTPISAGNTIPYQFQPVLDGQNYMGTVSWNVAGQRWYVVLVDPTGAMVFNMALVGSPIGQSIETLVWDNGFALGVTVVPTSFRLGDTLDLVISDCVPDGYNGKQRCLITGPDTFSYPLAENPGLITNVGTLSFDLDLLGGYGFDSTMVYRADNRQFEVNP